MATSTVTTGKTKAVPANPSLEGVRAGQDHLSERQARTWLRQVRNCKPRITEELVWETDRIAASAEFGIGRRIGLMTVSKDGKWFNGIKTAPLEEAHALACAYQEVVLHVDGLRNLIALLETAEFRLMIALAVRKDAKALLEHARAEVGTVAMFTPAPDDPKPRSARASRKGGAA